MSRLEKSAEGRGYVDLVGTVHVGSFRVDKEGKTFLKENSGKVHYDSSCDTWKYCEGLNTTTLPRKLYSVVTGIPLEKIPGTIKFINNDKNDLRLKNLTV